MTNISDWLYKPDLIEIKSTGIGQGKDAKKVSDFTINVGIRRPRDLEGAANPASPANPAQANKAGAAKP